MKIRTKSPKGRWSDDIEASVRKRVREVQERLVKAGVHDVHVSWVDVSAGQCELDLIGPDDQIQRAMEALADFRDPED